MSLTPRRVMIVGAGRGQLGLYRAAKRMGLHSIAAGLDGDFPGLRLADEKCLIDITDPEATAEAAATLNVHAVVTSCMDTGVEALGAVNDRCGLRGISREVARSSFDKILQKKALVSEGVPTAGCVFATSERDLPEAEDKFGYPLVIKKCHSQASDGVFVVNDTNESIQVLRDHFDDEAEFLIEEYLDGDEFGAQACVVDGVILFVMTHGDLLFNAHAPIPVGHYLPDGLGDIRSQLAIGAAKAAIRASGFDNCAVNIDFKMSGDDIRVVELTGRAGANGLPELVGMNYGVDYYESIINVALGEPVSFSDDLAPAAALVKMVLPETRGRLGEISLDPIDPRVTEIQSFRSTGDTVSPFKSSKDCIGQVSVLGNDLGKCLRIADEQIARSFPVQA